MKINAKIKSLDFKTIELDLPEINKDLLELLEPKILKIKFNNKDCLALYDEIKKQLVIFD